MEPSIQFANAELHRTRSGKSQSIGGVVPLRSRSRQRGRKSSVDLPKARELEDGEDEDAGLRDEHDYKRSQVSGIVGYQLYGSHSVGIQPWSDLPSGIPINRCDLRGHWHVASVCVLVDIYRSTETCRPAWSTVSYSLVGHFDGHRQVCPTHSKGRQ